MLALAMVEDQPTVLEARRLQAREPAPHHQVQRRRGLLSSGGRRCVPVRPASACGHRWKSDVPWPVSKQQEAPMVVSIMHRKVTEQTVAASMHFPVMGLNIQNGNS